MRACDSKTYIRDEREKLICRQSIIYLSISSRLMCPGVCETKSNANQILDRHYIVTLPAGWLRGKSGLTAHRSENEIENGQLLFLAK